MKSPYWKWSLAQSNLVTPWAFSLAKPKESMLNVNFLNENPEYAFKDIITFDEGNENNLYSFVTGKSTSNWLTMCIKYANAMKWLWAQYESLT